MIDWNEILDQVLHAAVGAALVFVFSSFLHPALALVIALLVGIVREQWQHPGTCKEGCRRDLLFWLVGSLAAVIWKL